MKDNYIHIIHQFLNGEINSDELKNQLPEEEYNNWKKTLNSIEDLPKADFDSDAEYDLLLKKRDRSNRKNNKHIYLKIAAVLIILIATAFFTKNYLFEPTLSLTTIHSNADISPDAVNLPDQSKAWLNKSSELSYDKENWETERKLTLNGEAYFDVTEGKKFSIQTENGRVEVLGTTFNVLSRNGEFVVTCYSGKVKVTRKDKGVILNPGQSFYGKNQKVEKTDRSKPAWLINKSTFQATPLEMVIREIENQKDVIIDLDFDKKLYFTGGYDKQMSTDQILDLLTQSLDLTYKKIDNKHFVLELVAE